MNLFIHFAQPWLCAIGLFVFILALFVRYNWSKPTAYVYPLTSFLKERKKQASFFYVYFFNVLRFVSLLILVILIGKPQISDSKSRIHVEGVDIVLTLDVSGSMEVFDDLRDQRSRWDIAQAEALSFIDKRDNDAIGLVIFGAYAVTQCPLTLDKRILKTVASQLKIGMPNPEMSHGTVLIKGMLTAARRLQKSSAKSKVIVLLTDGVPTDGDIPYEEAISLVKKMGIKVYTIGVGSEEGGFMKNPMFGGVQRCSTTFNKNLLQRIARDTGGRFFEAKKSKDLKIIYEKIDQLEKVTYETEVYNNYKDYFAPFLWFVMMLLMFEICMATFVWFLL